MGFSYTLVINANMNTLNQIDMEIIVKVGIFILGTLVPLFLIPVIEKRKADYLRKESVDAVLIELQDIKVELLDHVDSYFNFLLNIRREPQLAEQGELPVPLPKKINIDILIDLYKKSALNLTTPQRLAIKRIPNTINSITTQAQNVVDSFTNNKTYCIQSIKNSIKLSCSLIYELNELHEKKNFTKIPLNSNEVSILILESIGYNNEDILASRIDESRFGDKYHLIQKK